MARTGSGIRTAVRTAAVLAVAAACLVVPAAAVAAVSASFDDPIGDTTDYAPDLGLSTVTVGDDDTITLDTRIVPRPPAYWGGCAYYVGFPPFQTCVPSNMNVTWYIDHTSGSGSVIDGGADAKVTAVPSRGQTFWESTRWDAANGRFSAGAKPLAAEDAGGVKWTLQLIDLGIPKPATMRIRVVSAYKSYTGTGVLLEYSDTAGPGTVAIPGVAGAGVPGASQACVGATRKVNRLQRRIRAVRKRAAKGSRSARRQLRRLRTRKRRALKAMKRRCGAPVTAPAPTSAPPGCRLVTKPVLKQEGVGIYAEWVIKPEVVVECKR
jgi:hypothetical protein